MIKENLFHTNIFLIGFMGVGKSTVSAYMRRVYGVDVLEMDAIIAQREGMSISEIFGQKGEAYFRCKETDLLREIAGRTNVIIACGGGVPMRQVNVLEMKKNGRVVLLTARPETILERVRDSHDRPLLENNKTVGFISSLMEQRREKYEAAADLILKTDEKTIPEICHEMINRLLALDYHP